MGQLEMIHGASRNREWGDWKGCIVHQEMASGRLEMTHGASRNVEWGDWK